MKILVCIKQVPAKDAPIKVAGDGGWIREDVGYETNEPDAYALEEALRQREAHGGEVAVLSVGPARAAQTLREALAKGADRAIHVVGDDAPRLDSYAVAEAIARAIAGDKFDLIFTGLQSEDSGLGQTGVILAELLGVPHATIIMQVQPTAEGARVKRELESGYFQYLDLPLPAVLTIQSGINKLRYASLLGIKQAKNKPLVQVPLGDIGVSPGLNRQVVTKLYVPEKSKRAVVLQGPAREVAKQFADRLRDDLRLL